MFVCIKFKSQWLGRVITIQLKSISNRTTVRVNELHHWTMGMSCFSGNDSATMPIVIFLVIELIFGLNTLFRFIRKNKRCDYSEHSLSFVCFILRCAFSYTYAHDPLENGIMRTEQNRTLLVLHIYRKDLSCGFDGIAHKLWCVLPLFSCLQKQNRESRNTEKINA